MGRIVIKVGQADEQTTSGRDVKTRYMDAASTTGHSEGALGVVGHSLEFDALRRFYFQPALLIVDLETLEAQCVVVPMDGVVGLGRGADCQILIQSDRVSRNHAEVRSRGRAGLAIRDLNSTNGTFVNNVAIEPAKDVPLRPGDVAVLGSSFLLRTFPLGSSPAQGGESLRLGALGVAQAQQV